MHVKYLNIEHIGRVTMIKKKNLKNLRISVSHAKGIHVSVPLSLSFAHAEHFVFSKKEWLQKSLEKVNKFERKKTIFDENTAFRTKFHQLKIRVHPYLKYTYRSYDGILEICYPFGKDIAQNEVQTYIKEGIIWILRKEAKHYLPRRVSELAGEHGFHYNKVFVKNIKTRWGSCSNVNNINLNVHLMRLPDELIDYVILHELTHTVHKNHQSSFWEKLDKISGNARLLDKKLKQYRIEVF